jgi:hypothetical protein
MKYTLAAAFALALSAGLNAAADEAVIGDYVEARTAEVYTGGCIMGSEGEVAGREALMAWRVRKGSFKGVSLEGLSVVALVAGNVNLGTHELGGIAPTSIKSMLMVDRRATPAQQEALAEMARSLAPDLVRGIITTTATPITFETSGDDVRVSAGAANVDINTNVEHSPTCASAQWFEPLARVDDPKIGLTRRFEWSGDGLGARWTLLDRKSSFVGSFSVR